MAILLLVIAMFTDTHCHISKEYYENINEIIKNAKDNGIAKMIVNGANLESNIETLELAKKHSELYAALGYHPEDLDKFKDEYLNIIEENINSIIAIGEIGLDYHYEPCDKEAQKMLFEKQLLLAQKYNKPVIVHSRDATEDTISILKKYPRVTGSLHCFSGSLETAKIYIKMGYKLGFGGVTTFKNAKIKEVLKNIPQEAILLETDSPYLAPEPVRGTKNEPANTLYVAKFIASELNITLDELSTITESNVKALFDI